MRSNLSIIFLVFCLSACTTSLRTEDPVARVNGQVITVRDYRHLYDNLKPKDFSRAAKESAEIKNLVLKTLVRRSVILTEAKKLNVSVSPQELDSAVEKYKQGYSPEIFRENLLEQMVDESEWKDQIRQSLLISKLFDSADLGRPTIKNEDALQFYEKNAPLFRRNATAIALQIVVADKTLAEDLRKKVIANPKDFATLARKHSIGPEAGDGAKIQVEKDTLPPVLDRILFDGPMNTVSAIIESPYGFHILKVIERHPSLNKDFEQAKPEILKTLVEEQRRLALARFEEDLIRSAQVEYNRSLIQQL